MGAVGMKGPHGREVGVTEKFDVVYLMVSGTTTAARCPEILRGLVGLGFSTVIAIPTPNASRTLAPRDLADVERVPRQGADVRRSLPQHALSLGQLFRQAPDRLELVLTHSSGSSREGSA